jgi:hypothetical protein
MAQPQQQVSPPNGPQANYTPNPVQDRTSPDQPYSFITNPAPPPKQSLMGRLPGGNSIALRIGFVAGGLIVLLILFSVIKGAFSGGPDITTSFTTIVQDQQELIHLATNANLQPDLSTGNKNLAATMQGALASSQVKTISYLASSHKKINPKTLNLKVSQATDAQLTAAAAATTYNQTFHDIIQTKLTAYSSALQQTYKLDKGKKGRALLNDSYKQAQLLQAQLATPAN